MIRETVLKRSIIIGYFYIYIYIYYNTKNFSYDFFMYVSDLFEKTGGQFSSG